MVPIVFPIFQKVDIYIAVSLPILYFLVDTRILETSLTHFNYFKIGSFPHPLLFTHALLQVGNKVLLHSVC